MPLYHVLKPTAVFDDSLFATLDVSQCRKCHHLFNAAADSDLLDKLYRDSAMTNVPVNHSMFHRFSEVVNWLGNKIIEGNDIIEIGSGGGYLARILAQKARTVTVFEPNRRVNPDMMPEENIIFIPSVFPPPSGYSPRVGPADLVVCRNVIEHVLDPITFLQNIANELKPDGWAYVEAPNLRYSIEHGIFSDFYLQHVHYFTVDSLQSIAQRAGLIERKTVQLMGGHDFGILFQKSKSSSHQNSTQAAPLPAPETLARLFADSRCGACKSISSLPDPMALYGANLHSQSFLCAISDFRSFRVVIDDNSSNIGKMFLGRSQLIPIAAPSSGLLASMGTIVIGAFLHDIAIGKRILEFGFRGNVLVSHSRTSQANH